MKPTLLTVLGGTAGSVSLLLTVATARGDAAQIAANSPSTLPTVSAPVNPQPVSLQPIVPVAISLNETIAPEPAPRDTVPPQASPPSLMPMAISLNETTTPSPQLPPMTIVSPTPAQVINQPATTVVLQFLGVDGTGQSVEVELKVNGQPIDPKLVGQVETDSSTNLIRQTWVGVPLQQGNNTITAQIKGKPETLQTVQVQVRGTVAQLRISPIETRIPADGRSIATIQGELLDANGNRSVADGLVTLQSSAGEFVGEDENKDQPGFQVKAHNGQFQAKLRSNLTAQLVQIQATANELEAFTQLQFETNLRPSLVSGVIDLRIGPRGTDFYGSLRDFLPIDGNNGTQVDLRTAVFATGKVGDWLFTGAFNNTRPLNQTCDGNRLFQDLQSCDQNYPVYGDSSTSMGTAPSKDSLYLRLEQPSGIVNAGPNFFMWGDYKTEEWATRSQQYTAFTRQLHGFKGNYNFGNLQVSALYGDNVQGFQRDTIAPDGTSGYYFLSRRLVLGGSENVFLELEELNRPGTVLQRIALQRGPDYEIDYDRGTLLFRKPVLQTAVDENGQVLVRRIVVTYQYESTAGTNSVYGGRVRYHFSREFGRESWVGATYWRENQGIRDFELYGADALISLGPASSLILEYARSNNTSDTLGWVSGSAFRAELNTQLSPGIQAQAYYRTTDTGFANNATTSFVPGQTRYGGQITAALSPSTTIKAQVDHEDNFGVAPRPLNTLEAFLAPPTTAPAGSPVDNSLTTLSIGLQQKLGLASLSVDLLHRERQDRLAQTSSSSDQLRTRFTWPVLDNLTFLAQNETTLSNQQDSLYVDRTIVGLDWAITPGLNLRAAQQFFSSGPLAGNSITSLDLLSKIDLGPDTALNARYSILGGANGTTIQGAVGLNHRWVITPGLRLNLAYERVFGDFPVVTAAGAQYLQPFALGQSASTIALQAGESYSVGLEYSGNSDFQASARYEFRNSPNGGSNTVISAAAAGKISPALTVLMRYQQASSANQALLGLGDTATLRFGLAYRDPSNDSFNALLRYEYRKNPSTIPSTILLGSGTGSEDYTIALEAIYAPNWQWEFYGKFAMRASTTYLANDLVGTSSISLAQLRATYRLGYNMDLVGEARWIMQPTTGYSETGFSVEAGYYLTPNLRAAVGYSSGSIVAGDLAGNRSAGGFYAGLTVKLNELFDGFGVQRPTAAPPAQTSASVPASAVTQAAAPTILRLDVTQALTYVTNQPTLAAQDTAVLDQVATVLQQDTTLAVELQASLPSVNLQESTPDLSTQRVLAARSYLLSKGVGGRQVIIRAVGPVTEAQARVPEAMPMVLTGPAATFGLMAARLQSEGLLSPALDNLRQLAPQTTSQAPETPALTLSLDPTQGTVNEATLTQMVTALKTNQQTQVELQGYSTGHPEQDMERVIAVRNRLLDQDVDADRIIIRALEPLLEAQQNRIDVILSSLPTSIAQAHSNGLQLATALNILLGQDTSASQAVLRAMGIQQPDLQGVVIDAAVLEQTLGNIR